LRTEANIRKKRQEAIYAQEEYRRKVIEWIAIVLACGCVLGMIGFFVWLALDQRGMI